MEKLVRNFLISGTKVEVCVFNSDSVSGVNNRDANSIADIIEQVVTLYKEHLTIPRINFYIKNIDSCKILLPDIILISARNALSNPKVAQRSIIHELRHLIDYQSRQIQRSMKSFDVLFRKLANQMLALEKRNIDEWTIQRLTYAGVFRHLQIEGLARYAQYQPPFTDLKYEYLRMLAMVRAKMLSAHYREFDYASKHFKNKGIGFYDIGQFMVFSLLYHHIVKTPNEIAQMSWVKFIETCEVLQARLGEQILVSVTSGRGILDYARLVREAREKLLEETKQDKGRYKIDIS